jgi:hypothetical protein
VNWVLKSGNQHDSSAPGTTTETIQTLGCSNQVYQGKNESVADLYERMKMKLQQKDGRFVTNWENRNVAIKKQSQARSGHSIDLRQQ